MNFNQQNFRNAENNFIILMWNFVFLIMNYIVLFKIIIVQNWNLNYATAAYKAGFL